MSNQPTNASPILILNGVDDQSIRAPVVPEEQIPMHLPFIYVFSEKGIMAPFLGAGDALKKMLGDKTFDVRGKFFTHGTALLRAMNENGNLCMVQRLPAAGMATAAIQLCLDVLETNVPTYNRNADGSFELDQDGNKIPTGQTVPGFKCKWVVRGMSEALGAGTIGVGSQSENSVQSKLYPIHEMQISSPGEHGNYIGLRIWSPTTKGTDPVDEDLVNSEGTRLHKIQIVQRSTPRSPVHVVKTLGGSKAVQFSLKAGAVNTNNDSDLFVDDVVTHSYRDLEDMSTGIPAFGPFEEFFTYHDFVGELLEKFHTAEKTLSQLGEDKYLVDLYQARTVSGAPYHAIVLAGTLEGSYEMNELSQHFCSGGSDGRITPADYDEAVAEQMRNFGQGDYLLEDMAKYPFSHVYDSGFKMATKKLLANALGLRKDIRVSLGVYEAGAKPMTNEEVSSAAVALRAALRAFPESIVYGTSCYRGNVIDASGKLANSDYKVTVPATFELACKRSKYMGAADGKMRSPYAYDQDGINQVKYMVGLTNVNKPQNVRNKDWDVGLTSFYNYDTRHIYCPAWNNVYDNDTSILSNDINADIASELNKVCFRVWRKLVGNAKLTNEQRIERSNEYIAQYTKNRFDDRVVIQPRTFYTKGDAANGFSWHCEIHMYGNNGQTVATATVVTHRLEDLQ